MITSQFWGNQFFFQSCPVSWFAISHVPVYLKGHSVTAFFNIFLKGFHYASCKMLIALFLCSMLFFSCLLFLYVPPTFVHPMHSIKFSAAIVPAYFLFQESFMQWTWAQDIVVTIPKTSLLCTACPLPSPRTHIYISNFISKDLRLPALHIIDHSLIP